MLKNSGSAKTYYFLKEIPLKFENNLLGTKIVGKLDEMVSMKEHKC